MMSALWVCLLLGVAGCYEQSTAQPPLVVIDTDLPEPWLRLEYPGQDWPAGEPAKLIARGWVPSLECDEPSGETVSCRLTFESLDDLAAD